MWSTETICGPPLNSQIASPQTAGSKVGDPGDASVQGARRATVTAITPVKLWTLARDPFLAALGRATALNAPTADTANGELGLAGAGLLV
jgi:CRP-like cAMP-binding protein